MVSNLRPSDNYWKYLLYNSVDCLQGSHPVELQDEDNRTERTFGDVTHRKKYSHVDLIHMIGGMDAERGTVTSGGRGYYLMVSSALQI